MTEEKNLEIHLKELEISSDRLPSVAVWDEFLPIEMNPFQPRPRSRSTGSICTCLKRTHKLNESSKTIVKKTPKKLLKDPVLKYVSKYVIQEMSIKRTSKLLSTNHDKQIQNKLQNTDLKTETATTEIKTLLDGCERLSIGAENSTDMKNKVNSSNSKTQDSRNTSNASCSQEAIAGMGITPPCDVNMDELASYFETFVHIPKKMSSMAEMMYI